MVTRMIRQMRRLRLWGIRMYAGLMRILKGSNSRTQVNTGNPAGEAGHKGRGRMGNAARWRNQSAKTQGAGGQRLSEPCSDAIQFTSGCSNAIQSGAVRFLLTSVSILSAIMLPVITLSACSARMTLSGEGGAVHKPYTGLAVSSDGISNPVKLRLVYSASDLKWKRVVEDTAEAFMRENEDIEVELYSMPENKCQSHLESLKILAAQKEFFDIVEIQETSTLAAAGLLAPVPEGVSSLVENPGIYEGVCYGIPRYATTLGIIYNKDIFDGLGLSEPDTYEDFLQICQQVKDAGRNPLALGAADARHMEYWADYLFRNYMVTEDGEVQWTAKRTRQMLADYRNLGAQDYINPEYRNASDSRTAQELSSGKAAMVYAGPWMLSRIEDLNPQIHLGFFFLPGKDGITYAVQDRNVEWGISTATARDKEKMEAAERFLKFYYSEGIYENILAAMDGDPVTVRPVNRLHLQNQAIMESAYSTNPVRTGIMMENAEVPDGFAACFAQRLVDTLWGEESTSYLADDLTRIWEREAP